MRRRPGRPKKKGATNHYKKEEITEIIEKVVRVLAMKFRFGYFELEDIKQQARLFALEALDRFDPNTKHTLDNFLYTHVRNRLINFKRDNHIRDRSPCISCPFFDPNNLKSSNQCAAFIDKLECDKFSVWDKRATTRALLANPANVPENYDQGKNDEGTELATILDREMPADLRQDYLRLINGVYIPQDRKEKIQAAVRILMEKYNA